MNRLTELKQKTPSFGLRKRRSRRVSARGLASCGSISGSRFVRRAYEQTNVGLQPVVGQRLKEALKKKTAPPPKRVILLLLLLSTLFWAAGCENYYSSSPRATTVPGKFTEEAQSTSHTAIDVIIAALDTRMAACIISGSQVTGHRGPVSVPPAGARYLALVSSCGSMGITSREDTKPLRLARRRHVSRLPSRDQSTQQTEKRADERFPKIMAP